MDPQNNAWTPKPYQPKNDTPADQPAAPSNTPPADPYAWQRPEPQQQVLQQPSFPQQNQAQQNPGQPLPPVQPQPWSPPTAPVTPAPVQHTTGQPLGPTQQFGGQMAELPPLGGNQPRHTSHNPEKRQRLILWIVVALLVILPAIGIGLYLYSSLSKDSNNQKTTQQLEKLTYNNQALADLAKGTITQAQVDKLDKKATFFTAFKKAATTQTVQTKWDVFYTKQQDDERGDQYTLYDTTVDYKSKKYAYAENTYSNLGVYQTRCIEGRQFNFNDSKLTTSPAWQPASDSTDCKFNTVTMHMNDGMNTGGLSDKQADTFIRKIQGYNMVDVKSVAVAEQAGKQYLKVDAEVAPRKQSDGIYWGMQLFMNAFQSTGVDAEKHPYTYFGSGREGALVTYYIDPGTQLPVYAVMKSTAPLGKDGKPEAVQSWSHRYIEYAYPSEVVQFKLEDSKPITFSTWPTN